MRQALPITALQCLSEIDGGGCLMDARTPAEFLLDHVPGAVNFPVLSNEQRVVIGTLHATKPFEARRQGASMVASNIARMLDGTLTELAAQTPVTVYCWRGGNRSGALATILARVGWKTSVVEGGYKALRSEIVRQLDRYAPTLRFHVLAGRTGVGKSRILQLLKQSGAQVLDLEELAKHRGSVLGQRPGHPQPPQKLFESLLWNELRRFSPERPVFVESESKKVGQIHIPDALIKAMRASPCSRIEASVETRSQLLLEEYDHFIHTPALLEGQLRCLVPLHGHEVIDRWSGWLTQGAWKDLTQDLLRYHYDPSYDGSMKRNYKAIGSARVFELSASSLTALEATATAILAHANPSAA